MRRILGGSFAFGLILNALAAISTWAEVGPSALNAELFTRLDSNSDGVVVAGEISAENRPLFERLVRRGDANHDGSLSKAEFISAITTSKTDKPIEEKQSTGPQADAVRYLLLTLDKN